MTQASAVSSELDRLITVGQDTSLATALQRKSPNPTKAELGAGFVELIADRGQKLDSEPPYLAEFRRHSTRTNARKPKV